jgi:hypothetical protein
VCLLYKITKFLHGHCRHVSLLFTFRYCFFSVCLSVCACVRVFINLIIIAVISIDLLYLKVNYFINIFQNNGFSAWNFTDHIWVLEIW